MEDKLITLAIHTYEKALVLKSLLENEGVEVYIHNINLIQPMVSSGVRVRIKEADLPKALKVVETAKLEEEGEKWPSELSHFSITKILVPIDFSSHSMKAADWAIHTASVYDAKILFFHAYYVPVATGVLPIEVTITGEMFNNDALRAIREKVIHEMAEFKEAIKQKMTSGEMKKVSFDTDISEGVPEDEIIRVSKYFKPSLIVMGSRGKGTRDIDYLGSVTEEVIDRSRIPVLAIPNISKINHLEEVKNLAFIAQFNQKDLISFDALMKLRSETNFKVHFLHISDKMDQWDEVSLAGMQEYLQKMYPNLTATYGIIDGSNKFKSMEEYVRKYDIDMISLTSHKRNVFVSLFSTSIANQMLFHSTIPILVLK